MTLNIVLSVLIMFGNYQAYGKMCEVNIWVYIKQSIREKI